MVSSTECITVGTKNEGPQMMKCIWGESTKNTKPIGFCFPVNDCSISHFFCEHFFHHCFPWELSREGGSPSSRRHGTLSLLHGYSVSLFIHTSTASTFSLFKRCPFHQLIHRCDRMRVPCPQADSSNINELCCTKGIQGLHMYHIHNAHFIKQTFHTPTKLISGSRG